MKANVLLGILTFLLLVGQSAISQTSVIKLADFPNLSPTPRLDVFFPGENPPSEPYTKLLALEYDKSYGGYTKQVDAIRSHALEAGMDGILFQQPMTFSGENFSYLKLVGIGFKYDRNLTQTFYTESRFYVMDSLSHKFEYVGNVRYGFEGQKPVAEVRGFKWEFPSIFSQEWLNAPKGDDGTEKMKDGKVVRRTYDQRLGAGGPFCDYEYQPDGRIKSISFQYLLQWSGRIDFTYNSNRQEIERRMTASPYGPATIRTSYNPDGSVAKLSIFTLKDNVEMPLAEVEHIYSPLKQILAKS